MAIWVTLPIEDVSYAHCVCNTHTFIRLYMFVCMYMHTTGWQARKQLYTPRAQGLDSTARCLMSPRWTFPELVAYTRMLQCSGWKVAAVMTSCMSSSDFGLISTNSAIPRANEGRDVKQAADFQTHTY
jgi:hypothetical protein